MNKTSITPRLLSPADDRKLRRHSANLGMLEGSFAMVMLGVVESFYIPYLNKMGGTNLQIGMAQSLPALAAGLMQIFTPLVLYHIGSRKWFTVATVFGQAACFIPLGLMCHLSPTITAVTAVWLAISCYVLANTLGNLSGPAWADWMAHLIPKRLRGQYFSRRNRLVYIVQIVTNLSIGFLLSNAGGNARMFWIFTLIWSVVWLCRSLSGLTLSRMYEPPHMPQPPRPHGQFIQFVRQLPRSQFGLFALSAAWITMGVNFSGPFFPVHMLNNLHWTWSEYTFIMQVPAAIMILFMIFWGRIIDRFGTVIPLRLSAIGVSLMPLPWIIWQNYWVFVGVQIFSGICWSGFNLSAFIYYLDNVPPEERSSKIAYYNVLNLSGITLGAALSGILADHLPHLFKYHLQTVFLVSFLIRIIPALLFQKLRTPPYPGRLTIMERFFFDPQFNILHGLNRSILNIFKR